MVKRSRLTMMALDEYDAPQFDQRTNEQTTDCSDGEDNRDLDDSDDKMAMLTIGQYAIQNYRGLSRVC